MHIKRFLSCILFGFLIIQAAVAQTAYTASEFPTSRRETVKQYARACLDNYYSTIGEVLTDFEALLRFQDAYLSSNSYTYHPELGTGKTESSHPTNLNNYLVKTKAFYDSADMDAVSFTPDQVVFDNAIYKTGHNDKGCTFSATYTLSIAEDGTTFVRRKCKTTFYIENVLKPMVVKIHGIEVLADLEVIPHTLKKVVSDNPLANLTVDQLIARSASYDDFTKGKYSVTADNVMYYKQMALSNYAFKWLYILALYEYYSEQGDAALALACLRWNAVIGETSSIATLGSLLLGQGDYVNGIYWTRKAADNGSSTAQYNLGYSYMFGYGVEEDSHEACTWLLKAAGQGHTAAQIMMAIIYRMESGPVPADYNKSFEWMRKAAEQGDGKAWYRLAEYYLKGIGTPKDEAKGKDCYYKGAVAGDADAQYEYGMIEYNAKTTPRHFPGW